VTGFTKKGWKCQNNTYVGFKIEILSTESNILSALDLIIAALLAMVGENPANTHTITFETITTGSTIMAGSYTPSSTSTSLGTAATALATGLSTPGATLGTYSVGTVSASTVDLGSTDEATEEKKLNIGLIVGLAVGIPALVSKIYVIQLWESLSATSCGRRAKLRRR
jgi:hypothetical protein